MLSASSDQFEINEQQFVRILLLFPDGQAAEKANSCQVRWSMNTAGPIQTLLGHRQVQGAEFCRYKHGTVALCFNCTIISAITSPSNEEEARLALGVAQEGSPLTSGDWDSVPSHKHWSALQKLLTACSGLQRWSKLSQLGLGIE